MYISHDRLCVCLSLAAFPHYWTDPDVSWGMVGCPLVVHYWADLQSVHGFCCYDNIAPNAKCQPVLVYSLYAWFYFSTLLKLIGIGGILPPYMANVEGLLI